MVSKLIYEETNIVSNGTEVAPLYVRSDLFTKTFGFNVTLTVSNAMDTVDFGDPDVNALANDAWKTTVKVKTSVLNPEVIKSAVVNPTTKSVTITGLADGVYVLAICRAGYLTRYTPVTIAGANVVIANDKPLYAGDLNDDMFIEAIDFALMRQQLATDTSYPGYFYSYDLNGDQFVEAIDWAILVMNSSIDVSYYGEDVNLDA